MEKMRPMNTTMNLKAATLKSRSPLMALAVLVCAALFAQPALAHDVFAETLEADYGLKSVTCKTCHPNNKDRSVRNEFGRLVALALADKDITTRMVAAEEAKAAAANEEEGEAIFAEEEAKVAEELRAVLPQIEAVQFSVKHMFDTGMMNGSKLTEEAEVALQESYAEADAAAGEGTDGGEARDGADGGEARDGAEPPGRDSDGGVSIQDDSAGEVAVRTNSSLLWMFGGLLIGASAVGLTFVFRR